MPSEYEYYAIKLGWLGDKENSKERQESVYARICHCEAYYKK